MKKTITFAVASVIMLCSTGLATIVNIPDDYSTIQLGINASYDGDTVLVQPGTYVENLLINDKDIILGSLFLTSGDTSYISTTIVDGDSLQSVVRFSNCPETTMTITGFTIRNGFTAVAGGGINISTSNPLISHNLIMENVAQYFGGGINIHSYTNPTIINNQIVGNVIISTGGFEGGGISCYSDNAIISFNTMYGNYAENGGAICLYATNASNTIISNNNIYENSAVYGGGIFIIGDGYAEVTDNIISDNNAEYSGGALHIRDGSYPNISGNTISGNSAYFAGSGIYCSSASPTISNNVISNNIESHTGFGGGLAFYDSCNAIVHQNLICGNYATAGGGMRCDNSDPAISNNTFWGNDGLFGRTLNLAVSDPTITNTIIWPDTNIIGAEIQTNFTSFPIISYCDIYDTLWPGDGNISENPMFVYPDTGNFYLQEGSPCIDAGDPNSPYDPDSTIADMGAFYYDQSVGIDDQSSLLPGAVSLSQNYPNPFNALTVIKYELPKQSHITIEIFDLLGRQVRKLYDGFQQSGCHQIIWNTENHSSGVYFYKLQTKEHTETRKMVLLK